MGFASGFVLIILAMIATYHWYVAHIVKYLGGNDGALAPEIGVVVFGLWIMGIVVGKQKG